MKWTGLAVVALATAAALGTAGARASTDEPESARPGRERRVVRIERGGGYLGVSLGDGAERGALVRDVVEDGPAAKAGLKADDVVVGFDGETVRSAAHLARLVRETPAGRKVSIAFVRGGARQEAQVTVGEPRHMGMIEGLGDLRIEGLDRLRERLGDLAVPEPPEPPEAPDVPEPPEAPRPPRPPLPPMFSDVFGLRPRLGVQVVDLSEQLARYFKVEDGVLVSSVNAGSPADKAGLRAGDVIVKVDGQPVGSSRDLVRQVGRVDSARQVTLQVQRDGRPMDVRVQLEARPRRTPRGPTT